MLRIMMNRLQCRNRWSHFPALIGIAIEAGKIGGGNVETQPVAGFEAVGRGPHVDLEAVNHPRIEEARLCMAVAVAGSQHSVLQLNRPTVWKHVRKTRREI